MTLTFTLRTFSCVIHKPVLSFTIVFFSSLQTLKRKEKEYEHDMERLAREKIATQQRLAELKNDLSQWMDVIEIDRILRQTVQPEEDQASTSTASGKQTGGIGGIMFTLNCMSVNLPNTQPNTVSD